METAWRHYLACAGLSSAQGMGVCRCLLFLHRGRWISRALWVQRPLHHDLGTLSVWPDHARFVGTSTTKPYPRSPLSRSEAKHEAGPQTERGGVKPTLTHSSARREK